MLGPVQGWALNRGRGSGRLKLLYIAPFGAGGPVTNVPCAFLGKNMTGTQAIVKVTKPACPRRAGVSVNRVKKPYALHHSMRLGL